jgi:hypothetical protein
VAEALTFFTGVALSEPIGRRTIERPGATYEAIQTATVETIEQTWLAALVPTRTPMWTTTSLAFILGFQTSVLPAAGLPVVKLSHRPAQDPTRLPLFVPQNSDGYPHGEAG